MSYSVGWTCGDPRDYDREYCVDLAQLSGFLHDTQPEAAESLGLDQDGPTRRRFLARLQGEVTRHGTIDVLRKGVKHGPSQLDLMYGTPSPENDKARTLYGRNRFSVTRQLRYSNDNPRFALDLCLFINGLPIATFELKNSLTKQTVDDAVEQYKRDRNPRGKSCLSWGVAWRTLRWMSTRRSSARSLQGQGLVVPAVQPGLERRGGESAEPERAEDGLPVEGRC